MIKTEKELTGTLRDLTLAPNSPIKQRDGRWQIANRLDAWKEQGSRLFDEHLTRFHKIAIEVFREPDPQFELDPNRRIAASLYGKVPKHSHDLRKGLAETLALLGCYPEYLTSVTHGRAEAIARSTVRKILEDADWLLWASLNDVLPLFAEAAPNEFLDAVEKALASGPSPFDRVFSEEGRGFSGRNYMTGLLWALETLAWSDAYLAQVVLSLGYLAARDPGGNWANRPGNSLWTILLPWFPQTVAPVSKRLAAVVAMQKELPEVGWKLILNLLPQNQQTSSMTRKPEWRQIIPDDWEEGVTNKEYWEQISGYATLAVELAKQDHIRLTALIGHFNSLPPAQRRDLLAYLSSETITQLPEQTRVGLWNKLVNLSSRHRKYAEADWAMDEQEVSELVAVAEKLEPQSPEYKYRRLFVQRETNLYHAKGDYAEQAKQLHERRQLAVQEIYLCAGMNAVVRFAETVESPDKVGFAFGEIADLNIDSEILPKLLESNSQPIKLFAINFIVGRFHARGWAWFDNIDLTHWTRDQKALLLAYLPFNQETWERARNVLESDEAAYWRIAWANPYAAGDGLASAIDRLLENGRVNAAIEALEKQHFNKESIDSSQIIRALNTLLQSEENLKSMDPHGVAELLGVLQKDNSANQDEVIKLEWAFLGLLDGGFGASPARLQRTLATDVNFFCDVIRTAFRSTKADASGDPSIRQQGAAANAYRLLKEWRVPPGTQDDDSFDGDFLNRWLSEAKSKCEESGHYKIAMQQVGSVLFYVQADPNGLWLHRSAAEVLNAKDAEDLRLGFHTEIINSRGVHWVDPEGKPERELANSWREKADQVELAGYPRLAFTLREVADGYDREAASIVARERFEDD